MPVPDTMRLEEEDPTKQFVSFMDATVPAKVKVFAPMISLPLDRVNEPLMLTALPKVTDPELL